MLEDHYGVEDQEDLYAAMTERKAEVCMRSSISIQANWDVLQKALSANRCGDSGCWLLRAVVMVKPTEEQAKVIACEESAVVSARPGSGKTFTMTGMIAKTSEDLLSYQGIVAISYTRKPVPNLGIDAQV